MCVWCAFQSLLFSNLQNEKEKNCFSEILKFVDEKKKTKKKNKIVFQDTLFEQSDEFFYYEIVSLEIYTSNGLKKRQTTPGTLLSFFAKRGHFVNTD